MPSSLQPTGKFWAGLDTTATRTSSSESTAVRVEYTLRGQGYHRTLSASLWRDGEDSSNEEVYVMGINVTSEIYVDLDQVCLYYM